MSRWTERHSRAEHTEDRHDGKLGWKHGEHQHRTHPKQARKLLDSKIESVTALVKARQRVTDLKEQLSEAEREDKRAYVRATKDGWSTDQLKKLGLENGAAGRRRAARNTPDSRASDPSPGSAQE